MKTITLLLLSLATLPKVISAQPTVTVNEYYDIGDVVNMITVDPATINVDTPGANLTWDFSSIATSGGAAVTTITAPAITFGTSNIQLTLPNGDIKYLNENSTDSYVNGFVDHGTHDTITFDFYDIAKRPLSYMQSYLDTYKIRATMPVITGNGSILIKGDSWGTLKLPTGNYSNVLRIRKSDVESDTVGGATVVLTNITYQWFDAAHKAPLLELDSTTSYAGTTSTTAMYLAGTEGVATVNAAPQNVSAYINNNDLVLTGQFANGATYDVTLYSIIGTKIYTGNFAAASSTQRVETGRDLAPGIYITSISQRNDPSSTQVIKVVKQ